MSGFDANRVFTVNVHDPSPASTSTDTPSQTEKLLLEFLLQYRVGSDFIYRFAPFPLFRIISHCASDRFIETTYVEIFF